MKVARTHVIRRLGNFRKFGSLDAVNIQPENPLSKKVNGLHFYYMQMPEQEFVAVGVGRIILRAPVLLISGRHIRKGLAADPHFGDDFAMHLLVDMIVANPEYRDALGRLLLGLGRPVPSR